MAQVNYPTEDDCSPVNWSDLPPALRDEIARTIVELDRQRERAAALDAKIRGLISKEAADVLHVGHLTTQWGTQKLRAFEELVAALEGAPTR